MINVTQPFLASKEEYDEYLEGIWERNWLTNNGPLVKKLELELQEFLGLDNLAFLTNGTIAIQIALKALDIKGEVITTPFSYVATTSSIVWENCVPVFVDIHPESFNLDPSKIEAAITADTKAILATHVYGNPCDIDQIEEIAKRHNLKVIYDAAHCFGSTYKGTSVFAFGDISTTSFHATKLFHTIEGGAVIANNQDAREKIQFLRNFGHNGPYLFEGVGINGKNSEFHAAMGLVNLKHIDKVMANRKALHASYDEVLRPAELGKPKISEKAGYNYSYYPVLFKSEQDCLKVFEGLAKQDVHARRYFFPSLSTLNYVDGEDCPVSDEVACRILCLPLYDQLSINEIEMIGGHINQILGVNSKSA